MPQINYAEESNMKISDVDGEMSHAVFAPRRRIAGYVPSWSATCFENY
jgi:hypothetical protein